MKLLALAGIALAAVFYAVQPGAAKTGGVLAIAGTGSKARLGYIDPGTLKLVGKSTQVGNYTWPAARSPDGQRLVLAASKVGLRIVDLRRIRILKTSKVSDDVEALDWVGPRRIL